jgi:hypothetical protein
MAVWPEDPVMLLQDINLDYRAELLIHTDIHPLIPEDVVEAAA